MATTTFPYSSFLRGPSQVLPALADSAVILERRDDGNLVLMRQDRFEASEEGVRLMARSFKILNRRYPELAEEVLAEELSWLHWLPENERVECVKELLADLIAGADTGLLLPFLHNFWSWRSTAEVWSDPELARELKGPFAGDGELIERPFPPEEA
jgi:hypothetical protein